jgi:RNA polymerase sigma-70 factor, ECF subfamily
MSGQGLPVNEIDQLAFAARTGRSAAFDALVVGSYDHVRRFCAALVDRQSADDLTQETYYRCIRALPRFRGDSSARTWLLSIARHVCADELRSRSRFRRADLDDIESTDAPVTPDIADEIAISDLLAKLDANRREAFFLTQIVRLSYGEAASICGCPVGTIRSRVARAREDLITMLCATDGSSRGQDSGHSQRPRWGWPGGLGNGVATGACLP